jgi:DUF3014 family protein
MNENVKWVAAAVAVVGVSVGAVLYFSHREPAAPPKPVVAEAPPPPVAEEPAIKHPVPESPTPEKLPALADSDLPVQKALTDLLGHDSVQRFVIPEDLVRHFVVTVDNLSEQKVAQRLRPVRPTPGMFVAGGTDEQPVLDPTNYARYEPLMKVIRTADTQKLVATYQRYYPLMQDAYANLGHPPQYFNDRVVEVIDNLLATPEAPGPIALARPGVLYEYADPKIEALPAGQKLLIRMGPENAAALKAKLTELRAALVNGPER